MMRQPTLSAAAALGAILPTAMATTQVLGGCGFLGLSSRGISRGRPLLLAHASRFYEEIGVKDLLDAKPFSLPTLPFDPDRLRGFSRQTINYHYGKHHATYVRKLNALAAHDASLIGKSLEELLKTAEGPVFNNAAQSWNHDFYWKCISNDGGGTPKGKIADLINQSFGSFESFKEEFSTSAASHFGSGWVWLVATSKGLAIEQGHDAENPLRSSGNKPLLVIDVWEHAYYIDHKNARPNYISAFFDAINWDFVNAQL